MSRASWIAAFLSGLCLAGAAFAGPPQGGYSLEVGGNDEIWVPYGTHEECGGDSNLQLCIESDFATDSSGAVSATGSFNFTGFITGDLPMVATGQMGGSTAKPKGKVAISFSGPGTFTKKDGSVMSGTASGGGKLTCRHKLPADELFICGGRFKLCFEPEGLPRHCASAGGFEMEVLAAGGPWTLLMDLATDDTGAVSGEVTANLATLAEPEFLVVSGKYNAKKDRSSLKLTSFAPSKDKLSFSNLVVGPGTLSSGKLTFRVSGQSGKLVLVPPP
jgi:hypothetical protein